MFDIAKVLLIGMGSTSYSALESLSAQLDVIGIIRNLSAETIRTDPVAERTRDLNIPLFTDASPAAIEVLVKQLQPNCVVVSSYNRILSAELLAQCPFLNVHYSPLPRYRGRANVNWALINDEPCTAITIHVMAQGLDAGNILFQRLLPISPRNTVGDLYNQLNEIQKTHLASTVLEFLNGNAGLPQEESSSSYCCTRMPEDGEIDWTHSTDQIDRLIRGVADPFPGAFTYLEGKQLIIWKAEPLKNSSKFIGFIPGRVIGRSASKGYVDVLTGDGTLRVFEVQLETEAKVSAYQVIKSVHSTLGLRPSELLARIKLLEEQINTLKETCINRHGG